MIQHGTTRYGYLRFITTPSGDLSWRDREDGRLYHEQAWLKKNVVRKIVSAEIFCPCFANKTPSKHRQNTVKVEQHEAGNQSGGGGGGNEGPVVQHQAIAFKMGPLLTAWCKRQKP